MSTKAFIAELKEIGREWDEFILNDPDVLMARIWAAAEKHLDPEVVRRVREGEVSLRDQVVPPLETEER